MVVRAKPSSVNVWPGVVACGGVAEWCACRYVVLGGVIFLLRFLHVVGCLVQGQGQDMLLDLSYILSEVEREKHVWDYLHGWERHPLGVNGFRLCNRC